ncbi:NAD(P)H-dependent oxidoreductase [Bdellovibrio sp. SKB1291214]|uniref:NAD(P)H-dependent oxidoreductase n=1 Tax=Bdellovibrio sp. SKB1291214 TaxID=1732569 RepID=UPI000B519C13|nr:NAD(P)H-dependent oxidoreductase [Bdellovibrio sp. SKB1291214]UYL09665.1 NAD(P)H-dependent oxidoreductase [Bdellovibrio sp. SKB1291214]
MANKQIQEALEWRYAVKKFDPTKKISEQDMKTLLESLKLAPSSYGVQPWKFLVIENPKVREELKPVSWNQTQITDASHQIVFLYKDTMDEAFVQKYIDRIVEVRGIPAEALQGYKDMMITNLVKAPEEKIRVWSQRQAYIAMGFLLETAALLKIDATPMEGFSASDYDRILKLEGTRWKSVATVTLGYRHAEDSFQNLKKVRFADDALIEYVK